MEKRRMRLEINGVVCGLITQESEEYMQSLAGEVGDMMTEILAASPFVTREAAALTLALSYCDDAKKNGKKAAELQDRVDELEVEAEIWQEDKDTFLKTHPDQTGDSALADKLRELERENAELKEAAAAPASLPDSGDLKAEELQEELQKLAQTNEELRREVLEKESLAQKAEAEKQSVKESAVRAVEEAKRMVDELKAQPAQPVAGEGEPDVQPRKAPETNKFPESHKMPQPRKKNPLRHDEDFEQEGFVSFFEKKK